MMLAIGLLICLTILPVPVQAHDDSTVVTDAVVDSQGLVDITYHFDRAGFDSTKVLALFLMHSADQVNYSRVAFKMYPFEQVPKYTFQQNTSELPAKTNFYKIALVLPPWQVYWGNTVGSRKQ